jgi:hypothetical protein
VSPLALDQTGTQAAVYPSEEQLWVQGPPINAPGGQGVAADNMIGDPGVAAPPLPAPASLSAVQQQEAWAHEQLYGETPNQAYDENVVNNAVYGPQGVGDWNVQPYQTGHSQNIVANPAQEQGWGVGPARRWAHYPKTESPNPARNFGEHLRNGQLPWVSAESKLYVRTQLAYEQQWDVYKARSPVAPVVPVASSVPYVQTIPTYPTPTHSGGLVEYPGIDVPTGYYW